MFFVFTYGTLMNRRSNHAYLAKERFVGNATLKGYKMFDYVNLTTLSSMFPVIFKSDNEDDVVYGEVYQCQDDMMRYLDKLESEGSLYKRTNVVVDVDNGRKYSVCVYVGIVPTWKDAENALFVFPYENEKWTSTYYPAVEKELLQKVLANNTNLDEYRTE